MRGILICRGEASVVSDLFTFYGGLAPEIKGETIPFNSTSLTMSVTLQLSFSLILKLRFPVGVVGAILPVLKHFYC